MANKVEIIHKFDKPHLVTKKAADRQIRRIQEYCDAKIAFIEEMHAQYDAKSQLERIYFKINNERYYDVMSGLMRPSTYLFLLNEDGRSEHRKSYYKIMLKFSYKNKQRAEFRTISISNIQANTSRKHAFHCLTLNRHILNYLTADDEVARIESYLKSEIIERRKFIAQSVKEHVQGMIDQYILRYIDWE